MTGLLPFVVSHVTTVLASVRIFLPTGLMAFVQPWKGDFSLAFLERLSEVLAFLLAYGQCLFIVVLSCILLNVEVCSIIG